jgi:RNA polymerase sigma-70 factor (sigma-E family)
VRRDEEQAFREYVLARQDGLRRTAFLLARQWHAADDLVALTLTKLYRHWARAGAAANLDGYVHTIMANAWLDEQRRPWRRETPVADLPDPPPRPDDGYAAADDRAAVTALLDALAPGQRAVVVLRFYCDLSVLETADALGISTGTVKSQSARALEVLRAAAFTPAGTP